MPELSTCTAFAGTKRLATGALIDVASAASAELKRNPTASILIFDDATARPVDVDLRGSAKDIAKRLAAIAPEMVIPSGVDLGKPAGVDLTPRGPRPAETGRRCPRSHAAAAPLGMAGGTAGRRLRGAPKARRDRPQDLSRGRSPPPRQEAANRFMTALAGNEPGYEEATRALFAGDAEKVCS